MNQSPEDFLSTVALERKHRSAHPYVVDVVAVALLVGALAALFYAHRLRKLDDNFERAAVIALAQGGRIAHAELDTVKGELTLLASSAAHHDESMIAKDLQTLVQLRQGYLRALCLDARGRLVADVSAATAASTVDVTGPSAAFRSRAFALQPGQLQASHPMRELDQRGRFRFVIHFAAPIFDNSLSQQGLVIITYDLASLLRAIESLAKRPGAYFHLLNDAGERLLGAASSTASLDEKHYRTEDIVLLDSDAERQHISLRYGLTTEAVAAAKSAERLNAGGLWLLAFVPTIALVGFARGARRKERMSRLALAQSQQRLLQAEQLARIGYWRWDSRDDTLVLSPQAAAMLGRKAGEQKMNLADATAMHDLGDQRSFVERIEGVIQTGETSAADLRVNTLNGERWAHSIIRPARDARHQIIGVFGTLQDITARKLAEEQLRSLKTDYMALLDHIPAGVVYFDLNGRILNANKYVLDSNNVTREQIEGLGYQQVFKLEESLLQRHVDVINSGKPIGGLIHRYAAQDGIAYWWRTDIIPRRDANGRVIGVVVFAVNVSELKSAEERLRALTAEREMILNRIPAFVLYKDSNGVVLHANRMTSTYAGKSLEAIEGHRAAEVFRSDPMVRADDEVMRTGQPKLGLLESVLGEDGAVHWFEIDVFPNMDNGDIVGTVVFGLDVTERKHAEEQIHYLAMHDALTDLCNRRLLNEKLTQALAACRRHERECALLFVDLDRFKSVNDNLGHDIGDALLVEVARRLRSCIRAEDTAARTGGDEFVVLLAETASIEDAATVAEKIRALIAQPFTIEGYTVEIGSSIGIAAFPQHGETAHELMSAADTAMYSAKQLGRNKVCVASQPLSKNDAA